MGKQRFIKPEAVDIRGVCVACNVNPQKSRGNGKYRSICSPCDKRQWASDWGYKKAVGSCCERCGFIPEAACQLDVDHKDGDHKNDAPENLQTLCANCHRLKTWQAKENDPTRYKNPTE